MASVAARASSFIRVNLTVPSGGRGARYVSARFEGCVMAVDQWNGNGDWNLNPSDWSPSGAPPSKTTDAEIETGAAALTTSGTAAWLSIDAGAAVNFGDDALLSVAQWVQNLGALNVTGSGDTATIVGRLTNVGALNIGSGSLAATSTVTVGSLRNSGQIVVQGNVAGGIQAALKVTAAASATLTGSVRVSGDGALEYGSGNITSVGVGASLELDGSEARVTSGAGGASALTLLAANHGTLQTARRQRPGRRRRDADDDDRLHQRGRLLGRHWRRRRRQQRRARRRVE